MSNQQEEQGINPFFLAWAKIVLKYRYLAIALSLFSAIFSVFIIAPKLPSPLQEFRAKIISRPGLIVDTSIEAFSNAHDEAQIILEKYRDEFGRDDFFTILVEGDVFTEGFLQKLQKLHVELEGLNIQVDSLGERKKDRLIKNNAQHLIPKIETDHKKTQNDDFGGNESDFGADGAEWGDEGGATIIEEVLSLINARKTIATADGIKVGKWCDPMPNAENLSDFKNKALADPKLIGQVIGKEGKHAVIALRANFMSEDDSIKVNDAIKQIAQKYHDPKTFVVHSSGLPELNQTLKTNLFADMRVLLLLSILMMTSILAYSFRHIVAVVAPMIVVAISALNAFAMMNILSMPVTMLTNVLPAFLFCVGIGDSVHIISVYRDIFKKNQDSHAAIIETLATTAVPVIYTSLTTFIGLASFRFTSLPAIQDMGISGAIGVMMACVHSLIFLPAVLSFNQTSTYGIKPATERDRLDEAIDFCADTDAGVIIAEKGLEGFRTRPETASESKKRKIILWACTLITIIALVGISKIKVWHNPLSWLPEGNPTKISFDMMDQEVGGTANIQLLIQGTAQKGLKDLALLKGLEGLEQYIQDYRHPIYGQIIGNSISILDVVKETRQALKGGDPKDYRLPDTEEELGQLLFLFENTGPDQLRKLATNDLSQGQMTIRLKWLEATSYRDLTKYVQEGIERFIPKNTKVSPTGSVYTLVNTVGQLIFDLIKSFGFSLLMITVIMMILLKGLKLGFLSMLPNLTPILWLLGMMGFVGIHIDMNNILIASIAIGIAVDDTIHYLHHFRVAYEIHKDPFLAIHHSFKHSARAMVSTSVILMLGFFVYMSSSMSNLKVFGLLIGLSSGLALLVDLTLGPAIVRTFYKRPNLEELKEMNQSKN